MKLVYFDDFKLGVLKGDAVVDVSAEVKDISHSGPGDLMNGLIEQGFVIQHVSDSTDINADLSAEPGTWDHFVAYVPPWLAIWTRYHAGGVE